MMYLYVFVTSESFWATASSTNLTLKKPVSSGRCTMHFVEADHSVLRLLQISQQHIESQSRILESLGRAVGGILIDN